MKLFTSFYLLSFTAFTSLIILGSCSNRPSDVSTIISSDSLIYQGQIVNGKREGLGVLYKGDSILYAGHWYKGLRQGEGWVTDSLGRKVTGWWDHDTLVTGTRCDSTGTYTGEFNQHLKANGYGHFRDTLGTCYEGQWKDDERTGIGFSSQHRYFRMGEWKHDVFKGERLNYTSQRIYGIDISKHQHIKGRNRYGINWSDLRITHLGSLSKKNIMGKINYNISFIFIKSTEGKSMLNPYYAADYAAARAHGYPVGSYHFFSHRSTGAEQAAFFLRNSHFKKGDLPPVLDLEPLPSQVKKMGGPVAMWRRVRNWLQIVEQQTGMRPILYISQTFVNRYLNAAPDIKHSYPVWIARYGEYKPDVKLWVWQLAPDGHVKGIHGNVDINVFNGYQNEFRRWKAAYSKK
ncbi:MAG: glycosyl hydrolase family 25 [Prevotellaceae bacterium]|nr:glycosyl hydrolase family 25 [Prevotellaceae bacterium]